jgi:hypothetical protein
MIFGGRTWLIKNSKKICFKNQVTGGGITSVVGEKTFNQNESAY